MNEKEFLDGLKEDKWFDKPNELIEYRFSFIQYYLKNKLPYFVKYQSYLF